MRKTLSYSEKLFRVFKSLSIMIDETWDEYSFKYNGHRYNLHVDDARGTFFIYRQMKVHLIFNIHDNVTHHSEPIPREYFFRALKDNSHRETIKGFWSRKCCYVYTDLLHVDVDNPDTNLIRNTLIALEGVYDNMQEDITYFIME